MNFMNFHFHIGIRKVVVLLPFVYKQLIIKQSNLHLGKLSHIISIKERMNLLSFLHHKIQSVVAWYAM